MAERRHTKITNLELVWMHETEAAVLVASDELAEPVWLPKSQVEVESGGCAGAICNVTLPERLAIEKELV